MARQAAVYILASKRNGTIYIGVTSNLQERIWQHKKAFVEGFTKRHGVYLLVYYELHDNMIAAITREKQMKKWNRLETQSNRAAKSGLARFVGRSSINRRAWIPAVAGMTEARHICTPERSGAYPGLDLPQF
jgi:putative endonuclease